MPSPSAIVAGGAAYILTADDTLLTRGLKGAEVKVRRAAQAIQQAGKTAFVGGLGLGAALAPGTAMFVNFDDAIRGAGARAEGTREEFDRMREAALRMSRTMGFTATQVAEVMNELATRGATKSQIPELTESVLNLARASKTDAVTAAKILMATMNQFQIGLEDTALMADKLTVAANQSAIDIVELGESFKYAGTVAKQMGIGVDETLALTAALGQMGILGENAGTALRRLDTIISSEPEKLAALGVKAENSVGGLKPVAEVLGEIQQKMRNLDLGDVDKIRIFEDLFGKMGITAAVGLSKAGVSVQDFLEKLKNAKGEAQRIRLELDAGVGGAWRKFTGAAGTAAVALGDAMTPALERLGVILVGTLAVLTDFFKGNEALGTGLVVTVGLLVALGAVATVAAFALKGLAFGLAVLKVSALAFWSVLGLLATVPGLIVLGFAAAVLAWMNFTKSGEAFADRLGNAFSAIAETFATTFGGIVAAMKKGDMNLAFDIGLTGLHVAWLQFVEFLRESWYDFSNYFEDVFEDAVSAVGKFMVNLVKTIRVGFLSAVIFMVDKANDAAAALGGAGGKKMMFHGQEVIELNPDQEAKFKEKVAPIEKELQGHAERDQVLRAIAKRRADELARLEAARKSATPGTEEFKTLGEAADAARADLARVNQEIRDTAKAMTELQNRGFELRKSFLAGDRWIDTTQFEDAKKKIEKDAAEVVAAMDEIDRAEREARASRDKGRLDEAAKERKALQERLKMLVERANATEEAASSEWDVLARARAALEAQHVAPLPHMVGARAQAQIGDAARGVFQSADFRGALSLGPVSETAKQALDITKIIAGKIDTTNKLLADQNSFWGKGIPTPMDKDPVSFWH